MPELIAQGTEPNDRWRRTLPAGETVILGREATWTVPWDSRISRRHVQLNLSSGELLVRRLPDASNPLFFGGKQTEQCRVKQGEHFVLGSTTFTLAPESTLGLESERAPVREQRFSAEFLRTAHYRHADQRIEALGRLPELVAGAANESELCIRLVGVVLTGVPHAATAALAIAPADGKPIEILHWDRRRHVEEEFHASETLLRQAAASGDSVVHVWRSSDDAPPGDPSRQATQSADVDWAYCTPVPGNACRGWVIYVAGKFPAALSEAASDVGYFHDDLKFTEAAAAMLGNLRQLDQLQRRQAGLSQFFSPRVLDALEGHDPEVALAPKEADVTVLFCDLRGFSRTAEQDAENLLDLLHRVSKAMGVMTHEILGQGGVIGDFHGDAAMGFWGWPLEQPDASARACRAALAIQSHFRETKETENDALAGFRVGIGIAAGRAVAGKIGSTDQVKVTVFGPVVNLASRLEGMTKLLRAPILLDEQVAAAARRELAAREGRIRKVAVVKPYGMNTPLEVSELLPPASLFPAMSDHDIRAYEEAVAAFGNRQWEEALRLLHRVPAEDQVKDFLTMYIVSHNRTPPPDWPGHVVLDSK